jgi:hypothetical protein
MSRKVVLLSGLALSLMLLSGAGAWADYFYNFSPIDFPTVYSDNSGMGITLANQPQIGPVGSGLDSNVVAATMTTFINQGVVGTDTFNTGQHSTLSLTIIDGVENSTVTFGLLFSGSLSATNSNIAVTFDGPTTQHLTVNGNEYYVTLSSIVPPGIPTAIPGSVGGIIKAGIDVNPDPDPDPTNNTPEPSTMVLSCLGLSLLGLAGWRKRRASRLTLAI